MKTRLPSLEEILQIGLQNRLSELIEGKHPKFPDVDKVEILMLCDTLRKAEYLQIALEPDANGVPLPAYGDYIMVTVQGRDYLARVKQGKPWRRALFWLSGVVVGVVITLVVEWLKLLMAVYAKKHGLIP